MDSAAGNVPENSYVRYTSRTPRMRERQRFGLSARLEEDEEIGTSLLEDLVSKTWNVYAVSALFGFQRDDIYLKLYAKRLREEIASTLLREDVTYDANFSIMENMSRPNHENHPPIKIEVVAKNNSSKNETDKSIYNGVLLSWSIEQIEPNMQNSIRLPLLLCRGTRNCTDVVHAIISRMFDCFVIALPANEDDLKWLIPITIMSTDEERRSATSAEIQMEYTVPELPVKDTIVVKFHMSDLRKILIAIIRKQDNMTITAIDNEHIEMFYEVLYTQMLRLGNLRLGLCTLRKISLPEILITENKIKIMDADVMNHILLYLNEKALDTFHTVHIDI